MQLHSLEVTAFGPFAGTERVDFDDVGASGLFLLTGRTGAGKTSLLDAVCFALFGSVPGARDSAGRLRSDHAAEGVAPGVSLELTVGGRRLRIVRTPVWHAPRKRGIGDPIKQQPTAALSQWRDGGWEPLSSRIPEVADQVHSMLGMDVHQFTQVAMLPQGAFAQFLRSGAEERKKVLERLFATQRFRTVERWLVDHRRDCKTRSETALQELRRNVDRARGAAGDIAPGMQQSDDPAHWPHEVVLLRDRLGALHARALAEQRRLESTAAATSNQLEQARTLRRLQERLAAARRRLADLRRRPSKRRPTRSGSRPRNAPPPSPPTSNDWTRPRTGRGADSGTFRLLLVGPGGSGSRCPTRTTTIGRYRSRLWSTCAGPARSWSTVQRSSVSSSPSIVGRRRCWPVCGPSGQTPPAR
jgi:exonuclease SbcC